MRKPNEALMCQLTQKLKNVCSNRTYKNLLYQQNLIDLTYHSTRLEGNCLNRHEIESLINHNTIPVTNDIMWIELTRNHHAALLQIVQDAYNPSHELSPFYLRQVYGVLSKDNKPTDYIITGKIDLSEDGQGLFNMQVDSNFFCHDGQADEELSHLVKQVKLMTSDIKKSASPIPLIMELAMFCHNSIIMIDPQDSSNRMLARIILNYVILSYDLPLLVVGSEEGNEYVKVLEKCYVNKSMNSVAKIIFQQYLKSLFTHRHKGIN